MNSLLCMVNPFFLAGSRSSQFDQSRAVNPLPPCPDSPNCVRLTRHIETTIEQVMTMAKDVLDTMEASKIEVSKSDHSLESVFQTFIFKDDVVIKLEVAQPGACYLHIRSASRTGRSDLGVNRRRVKRFLRLLQKELER